MREFCCCGLEHCRWEQRRNDVTKVATHTLALIYTAMPRHPGRGVVLLLLVLAYFTSSLYKADLIDLTYSRARVGLRMRVHQ